MTTRVVDVTALACLCLAIQAGCGKSVLDDQPRIKLPRDIREYAREARANLHLLSPAQRAVVQPALAVHERAIAHFDRVMAMGETRRAWQAPLFSASAAIAADDVTGFGVADDIALPFLALGAIAVALGTRSPASMRAQRAAYNRVKGTAIAVSDAMKSVRIDDDDNVQSQDDDDSDTTPRTREDCIDLYVDCQQNARRSFPRRRCQVCMDRCIVNEYLWPEGSECDYK